jgi:hypothetical protein
MSENVEVKLIDRGIIDGFQTFEVINADTGETIGWNQSAPEETDMGAPDTGNIA